MTPPLVVVEASREHHDDAVERVRRAGWTIVQDFDPPGGFASGSRIVCVGDVRSSSDAAAAVLAAVRGAGVVVFGDAARDVIDPLCDDLRRLGPLEHITGSEPLPPRLDRDAIALLDLLLEGLTLGQAAARLHIARRTADRRLASIRAALGVSTTAEALVAAQRMGVGQEK